MAGSDRWRSDTEEVLALKREAGDVLMAISDSLNNLGWDASWRATTSDAVGKLEEAA